MVVVQENSGKFKGTGLWISFSFPCNSYQFILIQCFLGLGDYCRKMSKGPKDSSSNEEKEKNLKKNLVMKKKKV